MAKCSLNISTSPNFLRDLKKLRKTYRDIDEGLKDLVEKVQADYRSACHADRLKFPNPKYASIQGKVWKYDLVCPSLKKHPRNALRLVCMFLDDEQTLYAVWCYPRPNNDVVMAQDVMPLAASLRDAMENPQTNNEEPETEDPAEVTEV